MDQVRGLSILHGIGAIRSGHFLLSSGRCSDTYIEKYRLFPHVGYVQEFGETIAQAFAGKQIDIVIGMMKGGAIVACHTAGFIPGSLCLFAEPDRQNEQADIKHGYFRHFPARNVLVVEDILTTGRTTRQVVDAVCAARGNVIGVGALCNRGNLTAHDLNAPRLFSVVNLNVTSWEQPCPLCQAGVPHDQVSGHAAS